MTVKQKILVVLHDEENFSLVAENIHRIEANQSLEIIFLDVLKPTGKNTFFKKTSKQQLTDARVQTRLTQIERLLNSVSFKSDYSYQVLAGDLVKEVIVLAQNEKCALVLKFADKSTNKTSARDLNILRKCSIPFLLLKRSPGAIKNVAAAIDLEDDDNPINHQLNRRILDSSLKAAKSLHSKLNILSSWQLENESALRDNPFFKVSEEELNQAIIECEQQAIKQMKDIAAEYQNNDDNITINTTLIKGDAAQSIPEACKENAIDLLIMGTVARAGLRGMLVGNTAEEILPALECSVLAVKPDGFVSPY